MKLLRQLQSRIDRQANVISDLEFDHKLDKCYQEELKIMREAQSLDKRLYGELLRKMKHNRRLAIYIFNLEDKFYGKEVV